MFGYLNLKDPTKIEESESQEALNCRFDRGFLEYQEWTANPLSQKEAINPATGDRYYIDGSNNILRDGNSVTGDPLGCPEIYDAAFPPNPVTLSSVLSPIPPGAQYPAGTYEYLVTVFDSKWQEESIPRDFIITHATDRITRFTLADITSFFPTKTLNYRIYRRPLGGAEYLFVVQVAGNILGYTDNVNPLSLGGVCESEDNFRPFTADGLIFHQEKLFLNQGWRVYFSKTGVFGAFPQQNYFQMLCASMSKLGEVLFLFTTNNLFNVLYGDDETNFVLKNSNEFCPTIGRGSVSLFESIFIAAKIDFNVTITGLGSEDIPIINSIKMVDGPATIEISDKIRTIFPVLCFHPPPASWGVRECNTNTTDGRFLIFQHAAKPSSTYPNLPAFFVDAEKELYVVYDIIRKGWLRGDSQTVFQYQTKEFGSPGGKAISVKRIFIEFEGDLTLRFWGDMTWNSEFTLSSAVRTISELNVKPYVHIFHSFEFVGNQNAKIYDFGIVE